MKSTIAVFCAAGIVGLMSCSRDQEPDARESEMARMVSDSIALRAEINARDRYIDDVMHDVAAVYHDLEQTKREEARLVRRSDQSEGVGSVTSEKIRQSVLDQIAIIHATIRDNDRKLASMQSKLRNATVQYASVDAMVQELRLSLDQRERSIAALEEKVKGLENTVAEDVRVLSTKEQVIEDQRNRINTAYYIVGTKDELKQKGVLSDEGGILWGLLGTTTVLAAEFDTAEFLSVDVERDQAIRVDGKVLDMIPHRPGEFFAIAESEDGVSDLQITHPDRFWQDRYLVIVVDHKPKPEAGPEVGYEDTLLRDRR